MELRCRFSLSEKFKRLIEIYKREHVSLIIDETLPNNEAELVAEGKTYIFGAKRIESYLIHGYNRIIQKCPYKCFGRKCSGESCQKYFIDNGTGDCSDRWIAALTATKFFTNK